MIFCPRVLGKGKSSHPWSLSWIIPSHHREMVISLVWGSEMKWNKQCLEKSGPWKLSPSLPVTSRHSDLGETSSLCKPNLKSRALRMNTSHISSQIRKSRAALIIEHEGGTITILPSLIKFRSFKA